jgi:hypothetical protein
MVSGMRPFFAVLLATSLLALPALAAQADLTGTWQIDEAASESMDEMLLAWGTPGFAVKMMKRLKTSLIIEQASGEITIRFKTGVYSYSDTLQPGTAVRTEKRYGNPVEKQERWLADGTLQAQSWFDLKDGTRATTRSLKKLSDDGQVMVDFVTFTRADGSELSARRIYRRQVED